MRILILYPGLLEERRQFLAQHQWRLRLSGTSLILADDCLHPEDAKVFGDVLQLPSAENAADAWEILAHYLERNPVDGIVAQSETSLLIGARAAREFGLLGPSVEAVMATVNKLSTRQLLDQAGVRQPAYALVRSADEVRVFGRTHGWPVVLKASASSRQRLVTRVSGEGQVEAAVARMQAGLPGARDVRRMLSFAELEGIELGLDPCTEFLVEAFQEGLPLECDAMLSGTKPHWFGVCEQVPSLDHRFFIEGYLLPARLDETASRRVQEVAHAAIRALGLSDTGISVELRLAPEGPRVIEVNGRLPWDEGLQELVQASVGSLPGVLALKLAMGRRLPRLRLLQHAALLYQSNYEAGSLSRAPDPLEWKSLTKNAHAAWLFAKPGQRLSRGEHPDSRPHLLGVLTTDKCSTERALLQGRGILSRLKVEVKPLEHESRARVPGQESRQREFEGS